MRQIAEDKRLPADIDAQPPVQAAAALRLVIRGYHDEIEREERLPKALVEQLHAASFYSLVMPRELGGLQADPLTHVRVVELLAEAAGSVGWNLANNSIGQLVTLGLPDEGVHEIYAHGADTVIAGTAVMGGGRAVPVDGGYRVTGRWPFGTGCQETSWKLGSFQILDNQWKRWPGVSYSLPAQAWVGPHHSAVITGIARAGIDALIELAGEKAPRGRTGRLGDNPRFRRRSVGPTRS